MDALIRWTALKDEARVLTESIGRSGLEHHSLLKNAALLAAVRAQGIPAEHREWVWPLLLHAQVRIAELSLRLLWFCADQHGGMVDQQAAATGEHVLQLQ